MGKNYTAIGWDYARAARDGEIIIGTLARLGCIRALRDQQKSKTSRDYPYYFNEEKAAAACGFIERLPHVEGTWDSPTIILEPWQVFIVCQTFGWRVYGTDGRRFSDAYIEVARKNGKSAFSAGIALFCFLFEHEPGPQVKCAATTPPSLR